MTLDQYRIALANFDWLYDFSDDQKVWKQGYKEQQVLFNIGLALGEEALDLYFERIRNRLHPH